LRLTTSKSTNSNGVKRTLLGEDLGDELRAISFKPHEIYQPAEERENTMGKRTEGAELAMKIKEPRYAAPL